MTIHELDQSISNIYDNIACLLEMVSETPTEDLLDQFNMYHFRISLLTRILNALEAFKKG